MFEFGTETVDRDKLLKLLGDDFWMLLEDGELLSIYGQCQAGLNRPESAVKPLEKSIVLAPRTLETYQHLAQQLRKLDKVDVADYWMTEMVDSNRDSFRALWMRGEYRKSLIGQAKDDEATGLARDAMSDAVKSLRKAAEQLREKADANVAAAKALGEALEEAAKVAPPAGDAMTPQYAVALVQGGPIRRGRRQRRQGRGRGGGGHPRRADAGRRLALASPTRRSRRCDGERRLGEGFRDRRRRVGPQGRHAVLDLDRHRAARGQRDKAIESLQRARKAIGDHPDVLWRLASLLIDAGRLDEAGTIVKTTWPRWGFPNAFLDHLQACIDYSQGNWLAAAAGFDKVRPASWSMAQQRSARSTSCSPSVTGSWDG